MRRLLPLLLTLLALAPAQAQWMNVGDSIKQVRLTFDPWRIWDYNRYEGSRWGFGMGVEFPLCKDREKPRMEQRLFSVDGWFGYGVRDKAWKYGAEAALRYPHGLLDCLYLQWKDDLEHAGNRSLKSYNPLQVWDNPGYFSQDFVHVQRATVGLEASTRHHDLALQYRLGREQLLFDSLQPNPHRMSEMRLTWTYRKCLTIDLTGGVNHTSAARPCYLRALAQYSQRSKEKRWGQTGLFAQVGYASAEAPIQRWFDLGGTYDAPLFFRNTFLTIYPSSPYNRYFALSFLSYSTPAFYHSRISNPRLFAQVGAMVGENDYDQGLVETCLGIDRLLRWGVLDLGVAGACQVYPQSRFALMGVATLIFE